MSEQNLTKSNFQAPSVWFELILGPWALDACWALGLLGTRSRLALSRSGTQSAWHSVAQALGRWALGPSIAIGEAYNQSDMKPPPPLPKTHKQMIILPWGLGFTLRSKIFSSSRSLQSDHFHLTNQKTKLVTKSKATNCWDIISNEPSPSYSYRWIQTVIFVHLFTSQVK